MRWPLDKYWISNGYSKSHPAIDLATIGGTYNDPIKAPESGVITAVNNDANSYFGGKYIVLIGDSGHRHYMGHNNKNRVKVGQRVKEGQHIGDVGSTFGPGGSSSGPHIHYQVSKNGVEVNPENLIKPSAAKEDDMTEAERKVYNKGLVVQSVKKLSEGNILFEFMADGHQWKLDSLPAGKSVSSAKVKKGHKIICHAYADLVYKGKKQRYYITETDLTLGRLYGVNREDVKIVHKWK